MTPTPDGPPRRPSPGCGARRLARSWWLTAWSAVAVAALSAFQHTWWSATAAGILAVAAVLAIAAARRRGRARVLSPMFPALVAAAVVCAAILALVAVIS